MSKMSTDLARHALNGPAMGTRWSALFHAVEQFDPAPVQTALQAAVHEVDGQMSTWKPDSDLMLLNAAPVGEWLASPPRMLDVLHLGLEIGRASGGAFDIGMGDAVRAWGFGPEAASPARIRAAMTSLRRPAHELLELDRAAGRVRKRAPMTLDLNGVAKGYGVDRLAETLMGFGINSGLVGIDGDRPAVASPITFEGAEILLSGLLDDVDLDQERERLQKIIDGKTKQIAGFRGRLSNEGFLANAKPEIVADTRSMLEAAEADLAAAHTALANLG